MPLSIYHSANPLDVTGVILITVRPRRGFQITLRRFMPRTGQIYIIRIGVLDMNPHTLPHIAPLGAAPGESEGRKLVRWKDIWPLQLFRIRCERQK